MQISEVQISVIKPRDGLIAFASLVVDNKFYLGSIGVHQKLDGSGFRITYPTKSNGNRNLNIFHPINAETAKAIEQAIFQKLKDVIKKGSNNVGYSSNDYE